MGGSQKTVKNYSLLTGGQVPQLRNNVQHLRAAKGTRGLYWASTLSSLIAVSEYFEPG
jgi:hypothetical protein